MLLRSVQMLKDGLRLPGYLYGQSLYWYMHVYVIFFIDTCTLAPCELWKYDELTTCLYLCMNNIALRPRLCHALQIIVMEVFLIRYLAVFYSSDVLSLKISFLSRSAMDCSSDESSELNDTDIDDYPGYLFVKLLHLVPVRENCITMSSC
jgi:hypothetical protein